MTSCPKNVFDELPALAAPKPSDLHDELKCYLNSNPEHVVDVLQWWFERQHTVHIQPFPAWHWIILQFQVRKPSLTHLA